MKSFWVTLLLSASCLSSCIAMQRTEAQREYYQQLGYLNFKTLYQIAQLHCSKTDFRPFLPEQHRHGPVTNELHQYKTAKKAALELLFSCIQGKGKIRVIIEHVNQRYDSITLQDIETKICRQLVGGNIILRFGLIKFTNGCSLEYSFDADSNCLATSESSEFSCFFNIFDMLHYSILSIPYNDVIAYYQEYLGYNPQPYIDEYNNHKYEEWLKWRNQDPVGIFPGMSAANLHQLYETNDLKKEELTRTPWSPEQVLTVDSYEI